MHFEWKQEICEELKDICRDTVVNRRQMPVNRMLVQLMDLDEMPMHCPYHHFIMPAALLTQTAVLEHTDMETFAKWLETAEERAKTVPGGFCGECGTCGAAVGIGIFLSIYTGASPKQMANWQQVNEATALSLLKIASHPGPRCCKRTSFLAVDAGVKYIKEHYGIALTVDDTTQCTYYNRNAECLEADCPFYQEKSSQDDHAHIAIVVRGMMLPKQEPGKTCDCRKQPVDLSESKGVLMWMKDVGDEVTQGEILCEGEIQKLVVEFDAPCDGVLVEQCVKDGEVFRAGDVLGYIEAKRPD